MYAARIKICFDGLKHIPVLKTNAELEIKISLDWLRSLVTKFINSVVVVVVF